MTDRFNPTDIVVAHLKGLKNRRYTTVRPVGLADRAARYVLYGLPVVAGVAMVLLGGTVAGPEGILAGIAVLTGALFMAFTQVATWRERFTERRHVREAAEVNQRDSLDEAVAHLLMAMYASLLLVVVLVVGANFTDKDGNLIGAFAGVTAAIGLYIVLLLMIILPKLYTAYASINEVDDEMSGLYR